MGVYPSMPLGRGVYPACTLAGGMCEQGGVDRGSSPEMTIEAGSMHPTGMHTCFNENVATFQWMSGFQKSCRSHY